MDNELRELLRRDVQAGPFRSVEHAVSLLQAQESWLAEHRAENNSHEPEDDRDGAD